MLFACPSCQKQFRVPESALGKTLKCSACGQAFRLPDPAPTAPLPPPTAPLQPPAAPLPPQRAAPPASPLMQPPAAPSPFPSQPPAVAPQPPASPGSPASRPTVGPAAVSGNCAICQCEIAAGDDALQCPGCSGTFHADCWEYNQGCAVYGCSEAPPTEGLNSTEIPASHWGKTKKRCPNCAEVILAAAVRCKKCGAVFETANPQDRGSFQQQEADRAKLPAVKATAVALLIFGLLPCTAPITAIVGSIWYLSNRKTIAMLPGFYSALCKIAVGVSIVISVLLIGFTILNSTLGG